MNSSRQELIAFHSGIPEELSMASHAFSQVVQSILRQTSVRPEVSTSSELTADPILAIRSSQCSTCPCLGHSHGFDRLDRT